MNIVKLLTREIADRYIQENFIRLNNYFREARALLTFQHLEIVLTRLGENQKIPHGLGFTPQDVIVTSTIGSALVQLNYSEFDSQNLDISVLTGTISRENPTTLRMYVGTHVRGDL